MKKRKYVDADASIRDKCELPPLFRIIKPQEIEHDIETDEQKVDNLVGYIASIELSEELFRFETQQAPYSALLIFVRCIQKGYYPPENVLTFLSEKFNTYINGDDSLDKAMMLNKRLKKHHKKLVRDIDIVIEIDMLRQYFDIKTPEAIHAVCKRSAEAGLHMSCDSITDIYNRAGKRELDKSMGIKHGDIPWVNEMSEEYESEWTKRLLDRYPKDVQNLLVPKKRGRKHQ